MENNRKYKKKKPTANRSKNKICCYLKKKKNGKTNYIIHTLSSSPLSRPLYNIASES